jgi:lipoate synthase
MTRRAAQIALVAWALSLIAMPLSAERNLIPSLERTYDTCTDRPAEPDWMQNIALRDAYQRVLVQDIYRAQNLEKIVETGTCPCDVRFPAWDTAEATFRESYATATRWKMLDASETYNRQANELRLEAKAICEAAGNW